MSTIVLDTNSIAILRKCSERAVLHDAAGKVVGYFEPAKLYDPRDIPEFDEDELDRREARWEGISSAEARRRLEELL
jgi:hypothetical protein